MGVKECSRCDAIMCDRLLFGYHYLCDECWSELHEAKEMLPEQTTEGKVVEFLRSFLKTTKGTYGTKEDRDEVFQRVLEENSR